MATVIERSLRGTLDGEPAPAVAGEPSAAILQAAWTAGDGTARGGKGGHGCPFCFLTDDRRMERVRCTPESRHSRANASTSAKGQRRTSSPRAVPCRFWFHRFIASGWGRGSAAAPRNCSALFSASRFLYIAVRQTHARGAAPSCLTLVPSVGTLHSLNRSWLASWVPPAPVFCPATAGRKTGK